MLKMGQGRGSRNDTSPVVLPFMWQLPEVTVTLQWPQLSFNPIEIKSCHGGVLGPSRAPEWPRALGLKQPWIHMGHQHAEAAAGGQCPALYLPTLLQACLMTVKFPSLSFNK